MSSPKSGEAKLAHQVAVVTGASSGIGAELAQQLGAAGTKVGMLALPDSGLDQVADSIRRAGGTPLPIAADVADPCAVKRAIDTFSRELGAIDLLIMNAGIGLITTAESFSADAIERMFRVNVLGVAYAIDAALPSMLQRHRGHLVGVSSLSSYRGQPFFSGYCASKAAVGILLEGLRVELRAHGIAVTTVRPGFVRTPMTASYHHKARFMVDVQRAARIMLEGIVEQRSEINFPWQSALVMGISRWLPTGVYDRIAGSIVQRTRVQND